MKARPFQLSALACSVALAVPAATLAQSYEVVSREGDPAPPIGTIFRHMRHVPADDGTLFTELRNNTSQEDRGVFRGDEILLRFGDPLGTGDITDVWALDTNRGGDLAMVIETVPALGPRSRSLWFWNRDVPATGAPVEVQGTTLTSFTSVHREGDTLLVAASLQGQPSIARLTVDDAGSVLTEEHLVVVGQPLSTGDVVSNRARLESGSALAADGAWMAWVSTGIPLRGALLLDGQFLARDGEPSPVPGRNYTGTGGPLDLNDSGDYVFVSSIDGDPATDHILVWNGEVLAQTGHPIAPGSGLLREYKLLARVANSGDVFWTGHTDASGGRNQFLMRNREVLLHRNVTPLLGGVVKVIQDFDPSKDGRFLLVVVGLSNAEDTLVLADFGTVVPIPGCSGNAGSLVRSAGDARPGQTVDFELDDAQAIGALPVFLWSTSPAAPGSACGLPTRFGEILIGLGPDVIGSLTGSPWTGSPVPLSVALPLDPALVNLEFHGQAAFVDPLGSPVQLTNGLRMVIGAP